MTWLTASAALTGAAFLLSFWTAWSWPRPPRDAAIGVFTATSATLLAVFGAGAVAYLLSVPVGLVGCLLIGRAVLIWRAQRADAAETAAAQAAQAAHQAKQRAQDAAATDSGQPQN